MDISLETTIIIDTLIQHSNGKIKDRTHFGILALLGYLYHAGVLDDSELVSEATVMLSHYMDVRDLTLGKLSPLFELLSGSTAASE